MILSCCLLLCGTKQLYAQSSIVSSGNDIKETDGIVSYSVGQVVNGWTRSSNGTVLQGVQQAYVISVLTSVSNNVVHLSAKVYPNPTDKSLTLSIEKENPFNMSYVLLDLQGKILSYQKVNSKKNHISMRDLPQGTYFIKILNNRREIKTLKVIKN